MAPRPAPSRPVSLTALWASERWVLPFLLGGLALGVAVLALLALAWRSWGDSESAQRPHWLTTETVRATTLDGQVVKARVAMDAPDADTRAWINDRPRQVALLMQISVSEQDGRQLAGRERVQHLADAMGERLNDLVETSGVPPVRDVVIQDFVISRP